MSTQKFTGLALAALLVAGCGGGSDKFRNERDALRIDLEEAKQEAEDLQEEVDELEGEVAELEEELEDRPTDADVTTARQAGEQEGREEGEQIAGTAREAQLEAERRAEEAERQGNLRLRVSRLLPVLGGVDRTQASGDVPSVTVEHMRGESRVFGPTAFHTRGSAAPAISGWSSASFTRETSDNIDTIYLYTNIQPPNTRPFWKVRGTGPVPMTEVFEEDARGSSARPTTEEGTTVVNGSSYSQLRISGSFGGTGGTFTCDCSGTVGGETDDVDSHVTFTGGKPDFEVVGSWTFTPTSDTAAHQRDQDETYLYYGIWARHPKEDTGTPGFEWIAGGGAETGGDLGNYGDLAGTARFAGGAVGQYAIDRTSVGGQAKTGFFTATARLQADFDANQISGQISGFREGGSSLAGWNLYLQGAASSDVPPTLGAAGTTGSTTTSGTIDGVSVTGAWEARFYGVDNVTPPPTGTTCPDPGCAADVAGVAGWFNARDADPERFVAIGGAFGAQKQ